MDGSSDRARLMSLGRQLIDVHEDLREQIDELRVGLGAPGVRRTDLRSHCLAFCSALEAHHTDEDTSTFPAVAEQVPELRPVLDELTRDHRVIAEILGKVAALADGLSEGSTEAEIARVRGEIDGLAAVLESHFTWEERRVVAALDGR